MKELDELLASFLESNLDELKAGHWESLEAFLDQEDDLIWRWLRRMNTPDDDNFRSLVEAILHAA